LAGTATAVKVDYQGINLKKYGVFMATSASKKTAKGAAKPTSESPLNSTAPKDIWLAGLGAMAQAQAQARDHFNQMTQGLGAGLVAPVGAKVDRLEHLFEDRVARALKSLGLPTAQEVADLQDRVATLEAALQAVQHTTAPAKAVRSAARKAPAKSKKSTG
jgi:hypothetical protein